MRIGREICNIPECNAVFIEAYEPHSFISECNNSCYIVEFPVKLNQAFYNYISNNIPQRRVVELSKSVYNYVIARLPKGRFGLTENNAVRMTSVIALLCEEFTEKCDFVYQKSKYDDTFLKAVDIITENLKQNLTLNSVAKSVGLCPETLSRKFTQITDMTFTDYLHLLRISEAVNMLRFGSSVTDAAFESGFGSLRTFNRVFKNIMGMTPSEFCKCDFKNSFY